MASLSGHLAWQFLRGRYLDKIAAALGRPLSDEERRAFADDAHGGWWETSLMLLLRPDLVDPSYRTLPPRATRSSSARCRTSRCETAARVRGPSRARRSAFAKAAIEVLMEETMALVDGVLEGTSRPAPGARRSFALPFLRTEFWPVTVAATLASRSAPRRTFILGALGRKKTDGRSADRRG